MTFVHLLVASFAEWGAFVFGVFVIQWFSRKFSRYFEPDHPFYRLSVYSILVCVGIALCVLSFPRAFSPFALGWFSLHSSRAELVVRKSAPSHPEDRVASAQPSVEIAPQDNPPPVQNSQVLSDAPVNVHPTAPSEAASPTAAPSPRYKERIMKTLGLQGNFDPNHPFSSECRVRMGVRGEGYYCYEQPLNPRDMNAFRSLGLMAVADEGLSSEVLITGIEDSGISVESPDAYSILTQEPGFRSLKLLLFVPLGYAPLVHEGDSGSYIAWWDEALRFWEDPKNRTNSRRLSLLLPPDLGRRETYDKTLKERMIVFQKAMHLVPDGVIGVSSYVAFMRWIGALDSIDHRHLSETSKKN